MNLNKIKKIIDNNTITDFAKERQIIVELANDPMVLNDMIKILSVERAEKTRILDKASLLLGKAHVLIKEPDLGKNVNICDEIAEFYKSEELVHPFNI